MSMLSTFLFALAQSLPIAAVAQTNAALNQELATEREVVALLLAIILLQALVIVGLYRRKLQYKHSRKALRAQQLELEERFEHRAERLRAINHKLFEEIARHELTEQALTAVKDYLNSIINALPMMIIGVDRDSLVTHWNNSAAELSGHLPRSVMHQPLLVAYPELPFDPGIVDRAMNTGKPQYLEKFSPPNAGDAMLNISVYPLPSGDEGGAVIMIEDVTRASQVEDLMIQHEKMMSLGGLAAGMAHEINNPLSAILQAVQNIRRRTDPNTDINRQMAQQLQTDISAINAYFSARHIPEMLDSIREAGERAAHIVQSMLHFSRSPKRDHTSIDINHLINDTVDLASNTGELKSGHGDIPAQVDLQLAEALPRLRCSPIEIQQVLLNLLRNACQAFAPTENAPTPHICIRTTRARADDRLLLIHFSDNSGGMVEEVRSHIFEPFYTTKDVGQGTGLGLSVSYYIITEHHGGSIEVESTPGLGTTFIIGLPLEASLAENSQANLYN